MSWLTANLVIDWMAIVGSAFLLLVFGGLPLWALWDKFRPQRGEHFRPIGDEPAPVVAELSVPVVEKRRSPFAPNRAPKQREAK